MNCGACGHENPDRAKFCLECGAGFAMRCAGCDTELPPGAKFCLECGTATGASNPVAPQRDPSDAGSRRLPVGNRRLPVGNRRLPYTPKHLADKILQSKSALEGERKQVTVLFADVKGSMDLAEAVDAEELHRIMDRFFEILADGVHRFEGTVNQFTGDGIMALFGAPLAHEDHAQRACLAALTLRDGLRQFANELRLERGLSFATRLGMHSGDVVVGKIGDDLRMDYTAQGQTVNLAARMEQIAEPGEVYLTERTAKLVQGYMELEDLGPANVKGAREPVRIFALRGLGVVRTRLDVSKARGLTHFVGRDAESAALEAAFEHVNGGNGLVISVVAEAGTGKSRLCFEFLEQARARGVTINEGYGAPHGASVPLLPMLQLMRGAFGIEDGDSDQQAREKIAGRLLLQDGSLADSLPFLFALMRVPDPARPAPDFAPDERDRLVAELVRRLLHSGGTREPSILLLEDLHWFDPSSDGMLAHLVQALPGSPTLLLVNFRPGYTADWMQQSYYQQIALQPLGPDDLTALLGSLLGNDASLGDLASRIQDRSGGNPFFTEELVQTLVESGALEGTPGNYRMTAPAAELEMPPTVQAVLAARMDRLPEREKRVLQTASVIGRSFSESLLREVADIANADLGEALHRLTTGEFVHQTAVYPDAEYAFKHALTQEVAYRSQLQDSRQRVHRALANAIEVREPDRLDENAALLAHHLGEAGEPLAASRWHSRAAAMGDYSETQSHLMAVCDRLGDDPDPGEATELVLRARAGLLLTGQRLGLDQETLDHHMLQARELATRRGDAESLIRALLPAAYRRILTDRADEAREILDQALRLRDDVRERGLLASLFYLEGVVEFYLGSQTAAADLLQQGLAIIGEDDDLGLEYLGGRPAILGRIMRGSALASSGRPREGLTLIDQGRRMAFEKADPAGMVGGTVTLLASRDQLGIHAGNIEIARELVEAAEATMHALLPMAQAALGFAQLQCGERASGLLLLEAWAHSLGVGFGRIGYSWLARAYGLSGDAEAATEQTDQGLALPGQITSLSVLSILVERARWLVEAGRTLEDEALRETLVRVREVIDRTGAVVHSPRLAEIEARAAHLAGNDALHRERLDEALRLYREVGATGHVDRLEGESGG